MIQGRLKHSLKERCPVCGKVLQLRVIDRQSMHDGVEISIPEEYICCSNKNCFYERDIERKKRKHIKEDRHQEEI